MTSKILIVDDQPGIRMLLEEFLKSEGYETISANTGKQACEVAMEHNPDLILMDYNLPIMSGGEVLKYLDSEQFDKPVFIMTGLSASSIEEDTHYPFVQHVISKPFDIHTIRQMIADCLVREG
ncbi:response regulator [Halobacillus shinanisalinarum]|uniref:Response regulator n=1 Tax=Halobacillus shinanisalinarum TaxID=2932258 RepID=A0ABY4H4D0_9BACI|nr:response regulator [Halobacillus shinanisalinarum]UOQ94979.1 response regulator [Halobacillus shinanisalinarum]